MTTVHTSVNDNPAFVTQTQVVLSFLPAQWEELPSSSDCVLEREGQHALTEIEDLPIASSILFQHQEVRRQVPEHVAVSSRRDRLATPEVVNRQELREVSHED
jgi:hypothetical protein